MLQVGTRSTIRSFDVVVGSADVEGKVAAALASLGVDASAVTVSELGTLLVTATPDGAICVMDSDQPECSRRAS